MEQKRILVVDDDPPICELVKLVLEPRGYEVTAVYDGKAAIELLRELQPDVVVLDVMMPEMHGYDVCRYIKGTAEFKDIKVIMLTAKMLDVDEEMGQAAGADAYLAKPVGLNDLLETVIRVLRQTAPEK